MEKKWNLQDIRPATPRKKRSLEVPQPRIEEYDTRASGNEDDGTIEIPIENGTKRGGFHVVAAFGVFLAIVAAGIGASMLMGGAEVTVFPRFKEPNLNAEFTAYRAPQVGELAYEIMTLDAEGERQVKATGQEQVTELATGEITIYKKTSGTERLVKNTRFATADGKVFRITESAVVPGAVKNSAGEMIPGSIRAKVFADAVGDAYNLPAKTTFTVPAFKEKNQTDLYTAMYAENEQPIGGGFDGMKFIIDEAELNTARQALQTELRDALLKRVEAERPAGFVVFQSAVTFTYQSLPAVEYGDNLAIIKEKALLQIPIFKDDAFAEYLATATIPGYEGEPVRIDEPTALSFTYASATTSSSNIANESSIVFKLTGKPKIIWAFDENLLRTDLAGKAKSALTTVLGGYPAIKSAEAEVRPFWKRSFPEESEDISIIEKVEERE